MPGNFGNCSNNWGKVTQGAPKKLLQAWKEAVRAQLQKVIQKETIEGIDFFCKNEKSSLSSNRKYSRVEPEENSCLYQTGHYLGMSTMGYVLAIYLILVS